MPRFKIRHKKDDEFILVNGFGHEGINDPLLMLYAACFVKGKSVTLALIMTGGLTDEVWYYF